MFMRSLAYVGARPGLGPNRALFGPSGQFDVGDDEGGVQSLTNVQKLSLDQSASVGTRVDVSDGFYVSGAGNAEVNVFFFANGTANSHASFSSVAGHICKVDDDGGNSALRWFIFEAITVGDNVYRSTSLTDNPWDATFEIYNSGVEPLPTLTHPAHQQLNAASTAQGGVFVAGGTQDGVYQLCAGNIFKLLGTGTSDNGISEIYKDGTPSWQFNDSDGNALYYSLSDVATPDLAGTDKVVMSVSGVAYSQRGTFNGKSYFNKIGESTSTALNAIFWSSATWHISNAIGVDLDTSASAVATPDLATFLLGTVVTNVAWLNASDDSPASITVTSLSVGDLAAGFKISTVTYTVNSSTNGRDKYSDVLGVADDVTWNNTKWVKGATDINLGNVSFPFSGTPEVTVTKSNVAAEANWTNA